VVHLNHNHCSVVEILRVIVYSTYVKGTPSILDYFASIKSNLS
jgi:hypothetical protein